MGEKKIKTATTKSEKTVFLSFTGKQTAGWAAFLFFAFAAIFFTGTLVGRGDVKIDLDRKQIAREISAYDEKVKQLKNAEVEIIEETPELIFYETLQKKEQKSAVKAEPEKKGPPPHKKRSVVKRNRTPYKAIENTSRRQKPKQTPRKTTVNPVSDKDKAVFKYAIQVASFKGLDEARESVSRFRGKGFSAYYVKAVVRENEIWYRVRIGAYKDRIDAGKTLARLEKNNVDCFLVTR